MLISQWLYIFFFLLAFLLIFLHVSFFFIDLFHYFFKFIYLNFRLISLQYCSDSSAMVVHVFLILNLSATSLPPHPSGSSQCTSPEHPVSCIEPGLAICFTYDNIHVSMLFSQIIPSSPSPTESKILLYISVSFAISHIGSSLPYF